MFLNKQLVIYKVISGFLAVGMILLVLLPVAVEGGTLVDAYPSLKSGYPGFFEMMQAELKKQGVAEDRIDNLIIAWLEDLDAKLQEQLQQGSLTADNFASKLLESCLQLAAAHGKVTAAFISILLEDYQIGLKDIQDIIDGKKPLPARLSPLYEAIKQVVLSGGGGGPGGGLSPKVPEKKVPDDGYARPLPDEVKNLLAQAGAGPVFDGQDGVELSAQVWALLKEKSVVISFRGAGGKIVIRMPAGAVDVPPGNGLRITAKEIPAGNSAGILAGLGTFYRVKGNVFELGMESFVPDAGAAAQTAVLAGPVQVSISYADQDLEGTDEEKLGAYFYNEKTASWEYAGGKTDRSAKSVTFSTTHFSKYALMVYDKTFADIQHHWAKNDIEIMAARYIARGTPQGDFHPDRPVNRAEFAVMLVRVLGLADGGKELPFRDVPAGAWYREDLALAWSAGLVKGVSQNEFAPEAGITREQMAAMVVRALELAARKPVEVVPGQIPVIIGRFKDAPAISAWSRQTVAAAVQQGIISGYPDGSFKPADRTTRSQGMVMLRRLLERI